MLQLNFLSQQIFVFFRCNLINIHYHTLKQQKNKNYLSQKINYNIYFKAECHIATTANTAAIQLVTTVTSVTIATIPTCSYYMGSCGVETLWHSAMRYIPSIGTLQPGTTLFPPQASAPLASRADFSLPFFFFSSLWSLVPGQEPSNPTTATSIKSSLIKRLRSLWQTLRLSQVVQLLKRSKFKLELKREDRARVQADSKIFLLTVPVLKLTQNLLNSRCTSAGAARKFTKNHDTRAELLCCVRVLV